MLPNRSRVRAGAPHRRRFRGAATNGGRAVIATLMIAAFMATVPPAVAGADDDFSLAKSDSVDGEALIGEEITYTLTATGNHTSGAYLYNLSFRDILPAGVGFVSSSPAPTEVLPDVPAAGQTTVIWSNVSDLPANSRSSVSITVDTNPDFAGGITGSSTVPVGSIVTNNSEAVASLDAFAIPDYDTDAGVFTGEFDGAATASAAVEIIPFRVTKTAEPELLRGVHASGFDGAAGTIGELYTVEVENNPDYPVDALTLVDTLHPGLEFLGCDDYYPSDNTTVGDEWPGSGPVATGAGCGPSALETPETLETGAGGETIVTWDLGDLAPGDSVLITYQAGIPLFENRPFSGAAPSAASLEQGRNLDNNTGPSTGEPDRTANPDPELLDAPESVLDNTASATGTYTPTGALETDVDIHLAESEDLIIDKSMTGSLVQGTTAETTLTIRTSEYRDFTNLVVRDLLPSSLCFLGNYNSDATSGGSDWRTTDCEGAGTVQSTINGTPVDVAAVRELPDGGPYGTGRFELVWDFADASNAALADLDADGTLTITYTAVVRDFYRGGLAQLTGEPVLAGDSVTNHAEVSGPDTIADASLPADAADPDGGVDGDTASAGLENSLPTIDKRVSAKTGPLANGAGATEDTCADSHGSITWTEGDPTPELGYGPGDIVCFELGASFGPDVNYEGVQIQDLLPPGYAYVPGSAARITTIDTVPGTAVTESPTVVSFTVSGDGDVDEDGNEFRWVIAAELTDNTEGAANDINANLQKMVHNNNGGLVYQLRDQAAAEWTEPEVRLAKGVDNVNAGASNGADFDGSLGGASAPVTVVAGDVVEFRVDVWNIGNADALATEVQDHLPTGFACGDVSGISDGGTCAGGVITWAGLTVDASTGGGDLTADDQDSAPISLRYELTAPATIDPGQAWTNTAGVASYQGATNTAGFYDYYPENNIDPTNTPLENTDAADDPAYLDSPAPTLMKRQRSAIAEAGNDASGVLGTEDDEATIGEIIQYEITATIPEGTTLYDAEIRDALPAGLVWFSGDGLFDGTVSDLQPAVSGTVGLTGGTVAHSSGTVTYELPDPWTNPAGSGDDTVTITFYAQVADLAANRADPTATLFGNRGRFDWDDATGADRPDLVSARVDVNVVEPNPAIAKDHTTPVGANVFPGQTITYRVTVTNDATANNVSVAHDTTIVDAVPVGLTPLGAGGAPVGIDGDLVPSSGLAPVGAFTGTWSETNRTITWTPTDWAGLDAIDPDGTAQFTYEAEVDDPAVASSALTNTAGLTAFSLDQNLAPADDPNELDARAYTDSDGDTVSLPVAEIDKDIEPFNPGDPSDDIASFTIGEPVDYQVSVTLPSGAVAYDATLFDKIPAELDFDTFGGVVVGTECEVFDAGTGSSTGSPLLAADVETFNPVNGDARLAAWFIGDVYANGDCEVTVEYTAHVNGTAVDTDTVTNDALLTWNNSDQIVDQSPASLPAGYDDPDSPSWTIDTGPATETFTVSEPAIEIDKDATDTSGATLLNPTCDTTPGNHDSGSNDPDGTATDGCDISAGAEVRYRITATSAGSSDAHDITIVDTVPAELTPLTAPGGVPVTTTGQTVLGDSGSTGTWDDTARTITWTIAGPLAPGANSTADYDARVIASDELARGQDLDNVVDVSTYFGLAASTRSQIVVDNPANDDIVTYGNDVLATRGAVTTDTVTVEVHFPTPQVTKAPTVGHDPTDAHLDQPFSWTITVTNTDLVAPAFDVDVVDVLPDGWTYDTGSALVTTPHSGGPVAVEPSCTADTGSCGQPSLLNIESLTWTDLVAGDSEPLGPGAAITITFTATPESAALAPDPTTGEAFTGYDGGTGFAHVNDAFTMAEDGSGSTTCCDPDGPGPLTAEGYNDSDADTVYVARADIEVDKAISPVEDDADPDNGPHWFGSFVNYTITVDNRGPDGATNVTIADILDPTELEFDAVVSADQGTFDETTNVWNVGAVADGSSLELVLRVRLIGLGAVTNVAQNATTDQYDSDSTPGNDVAAEDDQDEVSITVAPTSLGDLVWLDLDGDGVQDPIEPGIPGVEVDLTWTDPDGTPRSYTTITSMGSYGVPPAVGLPAYTDITVTIDVANSPNLTGLAQTFDRDGIGSAHTSTDQVTAADTAVPGGGLADIAFDYGYRPDGTQSLGDRLWWDQDNSADATDGSAEPRLAGVDVTATWAGWDGAFGTGDELEFTTTTDATGTYLFTSIPPGEYRVVVDDSQLPVGLTTPTYDLDGAATGHVADVTVDPGQDRVDVDFSYAGTGSIGDAVWFDHDGDGTIDSGEPGLGGVTVVLYWAGGDGIFGDDAGTPGVDEGADDVTLTTITAHNGTYAFDNLPEGNFVVTVDDTTLPGGLAPTADSDGTATPHVSAVTLTAGIPTNLDQDFGYSGAGSIGDEVFFDVDGTELDGTPDTGDAALENVVVTVTWAGADGFVGDNPGTPGVDESTDDFTFADTTDAAGNYLVTQLPHGDYTITIDDTTLPAGMAPSFDADDTATAHTSNTTLSVASTDDLGMDFSYTGTGSIGDTVWFDQDADFSPGPVEVGFSGVGVELVWLGPDNALGGGDDVVRSTTTGPDGAYLFDSLPHGEFRVTVDDTTLPAGLVPTTDGDGTATAHTSRVTLGATTTSDLDQDFGYTGVGSLGDTVWYDVDDSATPTVDPGEPGLAGVDIAVVWTNPQGTDVSFAVTTDADGNYLVSDLPYGDYAITIDDATLPAGMAPSFDSDGAGTPHTSTTTLNVASPDDMTSDFSYTGTGSLGDTVWFDQDSDGSPDPVGSGIFDGQDQPLAGVDITVTWGGPDGIVGDDPGTLTIDESIDDVIHRATTDGNGEWLIDDLPEGAYSIDVDTASLPPGISVATFDADGTATADTSVVALDATTPDDLVQDFSYTGAGSVGDTVWFDLDGDGVLDGDEVGLAGIAVTLTYAGPDGTLVSETTTTGPDGTYLFEHLPFDTPLTVVVDDTTLPAGFVPIHDADGIVTPHTSIATLTVASPDGRDQDFGYNGIGTIGDVIVFDRDGTEADGIIDLDDVGIPNVDVTITWTNPTGGSDLATTITTGADGSYLFTGLPHGDFTVAVEEPTLPAGMAPTFDADGPGTPHTSATALDGATTEALDVDFFYGASGSMGDVVWHDEDGDGVLDLEEAPLDGVTIIITYSDASTGLTFTDSTTTDEDGLYRFDDLPPGEYTVTVDPDTLGEGWVPTHDLAGSETPGTTAASLGDGEFRDDIDFGYRPEADLAIVKSHDGDFVVGVDSTWTLTVTNDGPAPAAAPVTVTDDLPFGTTYVDSSGDDWSCSVVADSVTCTYVDGAGLPVDMASGTASTLELVVAVGPEAATSITNLATVGSSTVDPDLTDNSDSDSVDIQLSILDIDKRLDGRLDAGRDATYVITVKNLGPSVTAGDVVVTDELPVGLRFKDVTSDGADATCAEAGGVVTCTNAAGMVPGAVWTIELLTEVTDWTGIRIVNEATVAGGNDTGEIAIPTAVLGTIYADLVDPDSDLSGHLGIASGSGAVNVDVAEATVENAPSWPLALTGVDSRSLVAFALLVLIVGAMFVTLAWRREAVRSRP